MRRDPTEFRKRFALYKLGKSPYKNGKPAELPEVVITPDYEYNLFLNTLPDNQRLTPEEEYTTHKYWELHNKPKDFQEALKQEMYHFDTSDNSYHANSIAYDKNGTGYFMKPDSHPTVKYELDYYNKGLITEEGGVQRLPTKSEFRDLLNFRKEYKLISDPNRPGFHKYERRVNIPKFDSGIEPYTPYNKSIVSDLGNGTILLPAGYSFTYGFNPDAPTGQQSGMYIYKSDDPEHTPVEFKPIIQSNDPDKARSDYCGNVGRNYMYHGMNTGFGKTMQDFATNLVSFAMPESIFDQVVGKTLLYGSKLYKGSKLNNLVKLLNKNIESIDPYMKAVLEGDMKTALALRDLHFLLNAPDTKSIDIDGTLLKHAHKGNEWDIFDPSQTMNNALWTTNKPYLLDGSVLTFENKDLPTIIREFYINLKNPIEGSLVNREVDNYLTLLIGDANLGNQDAIRELLKLYPGKSIPDGIIDRSIINENMFPLEDFDTEEVSKFLEESKQAGLYGKTGFVAITPNPNLIKLADAITYFKASDPEVLSGLFKAGDVIPLSMRDNFNRNDIRFAIAPLLFGASYPILKQDNATIKRKK